MLTGEQREAVKDMREAWDFIRRNNALVPDSLNTMHRTEQQMLMRQVIVVALQHWAKCKDDPNYCGFDGRNEATVQLCSDIVKSVGDNLEYLPLI